MFSPQPKPVTHYDKYYEDVWLRNQACVACGNEAVDDVRDIVACHSGGGTAKKGHSKDALPLCTDCHAEEHRGARTFWKKVRRVTGLSRFMWVRITWARYQKEDK